MPLATHTSAAEAGQQRHTAESERLTRERLVEYFQEYNPFKIGSVDKLLQAYHGPPAQAQGARVPQLSARVQAYLRCALWWPRTHCIPALP